MSDRDFRKKPLYRKVNTKARGVYHGFGGDYSDTRNSKTERRSEATRGGMKHGTLRGLDYTPLYRFLLSRVGTPWVDAYQEARQRLDKEEPIFWMVELDPARIASLVRVGESSYYSGLTVDAAGILRKASPDITLSELWPSCPCCTHTFNGAPFTNRFDETLRSILVDKFQ